MIRDFDFNACIPNPDIPQLGYLCSYTPIEIIYAAGLQPIRLCTNGEPIKIADGYMHNTVCIYVRNILDNALERGAQGIYGMIFMNSCDAMRRLSDIWRHYVNTEFTYLIDIPRTNSPLNINRYKTILENFIHELEDRFRIKITEENLKESIRETNYSRRLLSELSELRREIDSSISSSDIFPVILASNHSQITSFNRELEKYLSSIKHYKSRDEVKKISKKPRILLTGSVFDRKEIIEAFESFGVSIIVEDTCTITRATDFLIEERDNPLQAIATAYLNKPICSRMKGLDRRIDNILALVERYKIDGIISYTLKFCDPELMFYPFLKTVLEEKEIPHLHFEGDATIGSLGQMRTRIQAFAEMLGSTGV
jgi:benzoyl-CoA reductase/2-hydroxyglutaryl-CoA dehydratase subunit BcrC/BadD/HgdB